MIINNYWTIVIAIGILLAIALCVNKSLKDFLDDILFKIIIVVISEIVLFAISFVLCGILYWGCNHSTTETYNTQTELVALNDYTGYKDKLNGYYFLFFGGVSSESSSTYDIRYAYKDDNNVIRIQSKTMNKDNIGFLEDNQKILEIKHDKYVYKLDNLGKFLFKEPIGEFGDHETDYIFHIPKDSIIKDVNIDLK